MEKIFLLIALIFFGFITSYSQSANESCHCAGMTAKGKGTFYITAGYNMDWFTKSDMHFKDTKTANYDFTIYDVKARDRSGLNKDFFRTNILIPQYSFRIGYWFNNNKNTGIEINYDHAKYVVINDQSVRMKGTINNEYFDKDTVLNPRFVSFEHTNGANYCMANVMKRYTILHSKNEKHWLSAVAKGGIGFVLPRTESRIVGRHRNDRYHVAGYIAGVDVGLRYDFARYFFLEQSGKGCFANYANVLLKQEGRARHHFFSIEYIFTFGFQFPAKWSKNISAR